MSRRIRHEERSHEEDEFSGPLVTEDEGCVIPCLHRESGELQGIPQGKGSDRWCPQDNVFLESIVLQTTAEGHPGESVGILDGVVGLRGMHGTCSLQAEGDGVVPAGNRQITVLPLIHGPEPGGEAHAVVVEAACCFTGGDQ